jgi:precorrin-8X/cobalt-precorrin-8 methylmutase
LNQQTAPERTATLLERFALPPAEIEARSQALVEANLSDVFADASERAVATRVVYAAGDLALASSIRISAGAVAAGIAALQGGAPILADVRMVLTGINAERASQLGCRLHCAIDDPFVMQRARASGLPRAAEAIRLLAPLIDGAVVAIGNAPTALLSLLDLVDAGGPRPALVIGMPVGFVAAAESKQELLLRDLNSCAIAGTRGGSPLAAATVNALLRLAAPQQPRPDESKTAVLFLGHGSRAEGAAAAMAAAVERVRQRSRFAILEACFLELAQPDLPEALRGCVERGASRVVIVPYFLHRGMHIRRDVPNLLRQELEKYPGLKVSLGTPIGLHADLAAVMVAGAEETAQMPDFRELPACTGACARGDPRQACCEIWRV